MWPNYKNFQIMIYYFKRQLIIFKGIALLEWKPNPVMISKTKFFIFSLRFDEIHSFLYIRTIFIITRASLWSKIENNFRKFKNILGLRIFWKWEKKTWHICQKHDVFAKINMDNFHRTIRLSKIRKINNNLSHQNQIYFFLNRK